MGRDVGEMIRTNYEQARNRQIILPHLLHRAVQAEPGHHGGRSFRDHLLVGHRRVPDRQLRGAPHPEPPMADGGDRGTTKGTGTMIPEITQQNLQVLYPGAADEPGQERDAAGTVLGGGRTGGGFAGSILGHQHGELASGTGT